MNKKSILFLVVPILLAMLNILSPSLSAKNFFRKIHNPFAHHHHSHHQSPKKQQNRSRRRMLSVFKKQKEKPSEQALVKPNAHPPVQRSIILHTKDGLHRKGVLTLRKNARGNIVMCHPAAYDKTFMIPYEEKVFSYYNCLRFDFRRHGEECEKQCSTIGKREVHEVAAAIQILKNNPETKNLPIYGFGVSMGAAVLIESESQNPQFDGLILQSTFASLRKQIRTSIPFFNGPITHNLIFREPVRLYAKLKYRIRLCKVSPERSIQNITCPIFLMHAQNDPVIPFESFTKLKTTGKNIIATWTPKTGRHTELFKTFPDLYTKKCNAFLNYVARSREHLNYLVAKNQRSHTLTTTKENNKQTITLHTSSLTTTTTVS